jgi:putative lipoprotein
MHHPGIISRIKKILLTMALMMPLTAKTDDQTFQQYQCDADIRFEVRLPKPDQLELRLNNTLKSLPQVMAASGIRYSDGETTVWLKGDTGMLKQHNQPVATNCQLLVIGEPLTPIRDAASGVVFIPPTRWTANPVQMAALSGSEIPFYGEKAGIHFSYRFRDSQHQALPLLDILVFPQSSWDSYVASNSIPEGIFLGQDGQRVFLAQLPAQPATDPISADDKHYRALQISEEELKDGFSMYGIVANNRVETVTAKISWLDRALYPGATLTVELRNVSRMDAPAEVIAKQQITLENGAPQTITLKFAPEAINPRYTYSISVRMEREGQLIKISDTHTPVLTHGAPREAEILLKSIK